MAEPHVARLWNHEFSAEAIECDFGPTIDGAEPSEDHLALIDGQPIGLVQYSHYADYPEYLDELAPFVEVPDRAVSIDHLIGHTGPVSASAAAATSGLDRTACMCRLRAQ